MTYASAPPNFSEEVAAARAALSQMVERPPPSAPAAPGFKVVPADDSDLGKPGGLFSGHDDTGQTEIFREVSKPEPQEVEPATRVINPLTSTAPIPSLLAAASAAPPPVRPAAPTDAMFAPAASPPRHRSAPSASELPSKAGDIRVETAASFEPVAREFVADQELVWRPGMTSAHPSMPPGAAPTGPSRSVRPDAPPRQRSLAFTDNEFWDPQRPPTQTMVDTDALEAHLQKPKTRISLPVAIGGALLIALIAIVLLAVFLS